MKNLKIKTGCGDDFHTVAKTAKNTATSNRNTEFEFNGVTCIVAPFTNLDWLYRDYANSWRMEWKEVGPDCPEKYSKEIQAELDRRTKIADEKAAEESRLYKIKEDKERKEFEEKTAGIEMEFKDSEGWKKGRAKNTDSYGGCVYDYAEAWAKLMQTEILKGKTVIDCAKDTSYQLGFFGITGFMYGCAVSVLSHCWKHGEDLRKWHNKEYKHEGDGVVNPAILTLKVAD